MTGGWLRPNKPNKRELGTGGLSSLQEYGANKSLQDCTMSPRFLSLSLLPLQTMALHIAFIAPPASHYVPMLPIAHQLLEEGHNVSFLGIKDTTKKLSKTVPKAHFHTLEADDDLSSKKKAMPYIQASRCEFECQTSNGMPHVACPSLRACKSNRSRPSGSTSSFLVVDSKTVSPAGALLLFWAILHSVCDFNDG